MKALRVTLVYSFVTLAIAALANPAYASRDRTAVGISAGSSVMGQPSLAAQYRLTSEKVIEMSIGVQTRDFALGTRTDGTNTIYGVQTSGLTAGFGFRLANLDIGGQLEASLLRSVAATGPGQMTQTQSLAFLAEPYAGIYLADWLHVSVYYPVFRPDPAIGPRIMGTIFFPADD